MDWFTAGQVSRTPLYYIKLAITNGIPMSEDTTPRPGTGFFSPLMMVALG
jgi:hypothetical protein